MPRVLLLHGLWNGAVWLLPLARRLRSAGFDVQIFGYASLLQCPDVVMAKLATRLRSSGKSSGKHSALIGHSLGGLIALQTLRRYPDLLVSRVVCLGSPLQGSRTAQTLSQRGWGRSWGKWALGRSAALLQTGIPVWQGRAQVGMVAGNIPRGMGRLLVRLDDPSDGTVRLAETRQPGLTDHCTVNASHSGLIFSSAAAHEAVHFIHHGRFTGKNV